MISTVTPLVLQGGNEAEISIGKGEVRIATSLVLGRITFFLIKVQTSPCSAVTEQVQYHLDKHIQLRDFHMPWSPVWGQKSHRAVFICLLNYMSFCFQETQSWQQQKLPSFTPQEGFNTSLFCSQVRVGQRQGCCFWFYPSCFIPALLSFACCLWENIPHSNKVASPQTASKLLLTFMLQPILCQRVSNQLQGVNIYLEQFFQERVKNKKC